MISYQRTLTSPVEPCTREAFTQILVSDVVVNNCRNVTSLRDMEEHAKTDDERRRLHEAQAKVKKQLPAFLFMASFPSGRRRQKDAVLNGLVMLDFDNVADPRALFGT